MHPTANSVAFILNHSARRVMPSVIPPVPHREGGVASASRRGSGGSNKRLNPTRGERASHVRCARSRVIRGVISHRIKEKRSGVRIGEGEGSRRLNDYIKGRSNKRLNATAHT
jgi:hypothetical protein